MGSTTGPDPQEAALNRAIESGQPVLIAFYRHGCKYCKTDEPVLEKLEEDLAGAVTVVRIDTDTEFGRQLAQTAGIRGVPTYFLVDPLSGATIYQQAGPLRVGDMMAALGEYYGGKE